jgi:hypothetical protein
MITWEIHDLELTSDHQTSEGLVCQSQEELCGASCSCRREGSRLS